MCGFEKGNNMEILEKYPDYPWKLILYSIY